MRRPTITAALSMCLAAALMVGNFDPVAASGTTRSGSGLPKGFRAQSLSWISAQQGWVLGDMGCATSRCATVVGTTDGGGTWKTLGTMGAPLTLEKASGVTELRFADSLHGWAFNPGFWSTSDGGKTWKKRTPPGGGHRVLALAGSPEGVYAVVTPCRLNHECNDPAGLWRSGVDGKSWTQVPVTLPVTFYAVLAVHGVVAYLVIPATFALAPDTLDVTVDGKQWSSRPDPCVPANDEALVDVAPSSDTNVALLCVGNPGFSMADKRVLRSNDTGKTTSPAGSTDRHGIVSQLAAAPNGTLAVSSFSDGSWIYLNQGGQTWTTSEALADGGQGWNDIVFTTNKVGWIVHGPAAENRFEPGELWGTQDGGLTWAPV